jgi:hypothetical protein
MRARDDARMRKEVRLLADGPFHGVENGPKAKPTCGAS